jgi:hypothetical protein
LKAVLGLRSGENLFYEGGKWASAAYIPAYARRFPFCMARVNLNNVEQKNRQLVREVIGYARYDTPEQVRWLPRRQALGIPLPASDFWLIDDRLVRFNHFSGDGEAIEPEMSDDPGVVALCSSAFEAVWDRAVPHEKYTLV